MAKIKTKRFMDSQEELNGLYVKPQWRWQVSLNNLRAAQERQKSQNDNSAGWNDERVNRLGCKQEPSKNL